MITYQIELYDDVIDELWPLLESNFAEAVRFKDKFELAPNGTMYSYAEQHNMFVLYTARDDGNLVGYAAYFISPSSHFADKLSASNDVIYVKEDYRDKDVASSLLKYAETDLKELGVELVLLCFKRQSSLPTALGYELEEYKYSKYIGD